MNQFRTVLSNCIPQMHDSFSTKQNSHKLFLLVCRTPFGEYVYVCFIKTKHRALDSEIAKVPLTVTKVSSILYILFLHLFYVNSFIKHNGSNFFGRIIFPVQIFPVFAADQISTRSLTI